MAIRLIAILLVLALIRFVPELARLRQFDGWRAWYERVAQSSGAAPLLCVGAPVAIAFIVQWGLRGILFGVVSLAFACAVLFYCWGPRDLERDVEAVEKAPDSARRAQAAQALLPDGRVGPLAYDAESLVAATFESALKRWFGVLFWFALLGPAGALLYRLLQLAAFEPGLAESRAAADARRAATVIDWLPAHFVALALAIVSDFDAVLKSWRDWHATRGDKFELNPGFLDAIARASVDADVAADEAYREQDAHSPLVALSDAMVLVRRVLIAWLTVISLVVLGGWFG